MRYRDRNGNEISNPSKQDQLLDDLYSNSISRMGLKIFSAPCISRMVGALLNTWPSSFLINPFVKKNHIDMKEYVIKRYSSYNDFFKREIRKEKRPIASNPLSLITPSDGKVSAYKIEENSKFRIKNSYYSIDTLLKDRELAKEFLGGTVVIIRLTVDNYHRYCYVDDANKGRNHFIKGKLYTVNPVILDHVNIYKENSRSYCMLETKNFGQIIQMEVGALMVGKINNHHRVAKVKRGQEKGMFEFGGSTIVLLLQKDKVMIHEDIMNNTKEGYETIVKMGETIGEAYKA